MINAVLFALAQLIGTPAEPPPVEEVALFPSSQVVAETLIRYDQHRQWVGMQIALCSNEAERQRWYAHMDRAKEAFRVWDKVRYLHVWHSGQHKDCTLWEPDERYVPSREVVRRTLDELKQTLTPLYYYGGVMPDLPQWPRIEPPKDVEVVPLPGGED